MKKFFTVLMIALAVAVFLPAMTCQALDYQSVSVTHLKWIVGNWYDSKGNLVLTISNDYKINGCAVMAVGFVGDTAGMYKIRINEGTRYKDIEVCHDDGDYHEGLVLNWLNNNAVSLRRTKEPRYFESVGGIYLGMDKNQVVSLYGQPSSIVNNIQNNATWKYKKEGFDVRFYCGVVVEITIYSNGNRRFDWSGLSANSSKADFAYKYNSEVSHRGSIRIGHGEVIAIGTGKVTLQILDPGYVG